jgi:hypothetical protein
MSHIRDQAMDFREKTALFLSCLSHRRPIESPSNYFWTVYGCRKNPAAEQSSLQIEGGADTVVVAANADAG